MGFGQPAVLLYDAELLVAIHAQNATEYAGGMVMVGVPPDFVAGYAADSASEALSDEHGDPLNLGDTVPFPDVAPSLAVCSAVVSQV